MSTAATKPVKLQINTSGAWRNVIDFDAADDNASASVMGHAAVLADIGKGTLRIVTSDGMQTALCSWTPEKGWYDSKTGKALS